LVYLALFNTEYRRQFEATVPEEGWEWLRRKYGYDEGLRIAFALLYKPRVKKLATRKRNKAYRDFIDRTIDRREFVAKIGESKASVLKREAHRRLASPDRFIVFRKGEAKIEDTRKAQYRLEKAKKRLKKGGIARVFEE